MHGGIFMIQNNTEMIKIMLKYNSLKFYYLTKCRQIRRTIFILQRKIMKGITLIDSTKNI